MTAVSPTLPPGSTLTDLPPGSTLTDLPPGSTLPLVGLLEILDAHHVNLRDDFFHRPAALPPRLLVPRSLIVAGRWQPRGVFVDAEINDLAESIRTNGIINRLLVFVNERGRFELVAGERRLRAAGLAALSLVPVEILEGSSRKLREWSIVDNIQRENLKPWEEGAAFDQMITVLGISEAELARRMGKNRAYIQQRRALAGAAPELIKALADEAIPFGVARGLLAGSGGDAAVQRMALTAVLKDAKAGKPVTEAQARKLATESVTVARIEAVRAQGWHVLKHYIGPLILWSPNDRPRIVTDLDLVALICSGARPQAPVTPVATWEPAGEDYTTLMRRGYQMNTSTLEPWILLVDDAKDLRFFRADEMAELARQAQAELDAVAERAALAGWAIRWIGNTAMFVQGNKKTQGAYTLKDQLKLVDQLIDGTGKAFLLVRSTCPVCHSWLDDQEIIWHRQTHIHAACKDAADLQLTLDQPPLDQPPLDQPPLDQPPLDQPPLDDVEHTKLCMKAEQILAAVIDQFAGFELRVLCLALGLDSDDLDADSIWAIGTSYLRNSSPEELRAALEGSNADR